MTRLEKCKTAIEKGFTYNPETGEIKSRFSRVITRKCSKGYIIIQFRKNSKNYVLFGHHFAFYFVYNKIVEQLDHINRIRHDNRIINLRETTKQYNAWNTNAKGCYWDKYSKKWRAYIGVNYKNVYLGDFNTEEEAHKAYLKAKEEFI